MRIKSVEVYQYRIPFHPVFGKARTRRFRRPARAVRSGILLRLVGIHEFESWGEISPLPGRSTESLNEASKVVLSVIDDLVGSRLPASWAELKEMSTTEGMPSSCRFGIEQAVSCLSASAAGVPLSMWINPEARHHVRVNALLAGSVDEVVHQATQRVREGFDVFKLKVGGFDIEREQSKVRKVRELLGSDPELRLDANRSWDFETTVRFLKGIEDQQIAYVEEPLLNSSELRELSGETTIPLAVDESVEEMMQSPCDTHDWSYLAAAVLKPTLCRGMLGTMAWAEHFLQAKVEPVVTSAFETAIGLSGITAMAAAIGGSGWAAGLDTLRYLSDKELTDDPDLGCPERRAVSLADWAHVDTARLERIH